MEESGRRHGNAFALLRGLQSLQIGGEWPARIGTRTGTPWLESHWSSTTCGGLICIRPRNHGRGVRTIGEKGAFFFFFIGSFAYQVGIIGGTKRNSKITLATKRTNEIEGTAPAFRGPIKNQDETWEEEQQMMMMMMMMMMKAWKKRNRLVKRPQRIAGRP